MNIVPSTAPVNLTVGTDAIGKRPELEKLVGDCLIAWPHVEAEMALYLGELLGTVTASTLAVFQALRRSSGQREAVLAAGRIELDDRDLELLEALLTVHKATETERTALAHGHFGISESVPDGLIWMNATDYVEIRMALKRKPPNDAAMNELLSRVWIYRRDDLTTIFANISEMAKIWYNLTVYDQMADGSPRSKLYGDICARPRIKSELEQRRKTNSAVKHSAKVGKFKPRLRAKS